MMMTSTFRPVVAVGRPAQLNRLLEMVLDVGPYDVVFLESTEHAYSHIKTMTPRLIVVRLDVDDLDGFHVLSMLKLDEDTRHIPVITWTAAQEDEAAPQEWPVQAEVGSDEPAAMRLH